MYKWGKHTHIYKRGNVEELLNLSSVGLELKIKTTHTFWLIAYAQLCIQINLTRPEGVFLNENQRCVFTYK